MRVSRRGLLVSTVGGIAAARAIGGTGKYIFGVVAPTADFDKSVQYGFDYHEPSVCEVAGMSDEAFASFKAHVFQSPIRCLRLNFFTSPPAGFKLPVIRVVGPEVDKVAVQAYVEKSLQRCSELGAQIIVWGSAASRMVPDGFSRDRAWAQIQEFLRMTDPVARSHKITVAIEPIRTPSSNILSTGAEVLKMQQADRSYPLCQSQYRSSDFRLATESERGS
jgi:hypothetical protein